MAYYGFAKAIMAGTPVTLYAGGKLKRDFTFIDDIIAGVIGALDHPPAPSEGARVLNIGNNRSETVNRLVELLEAALGRRAVIEEVPQPAADVVETWANVDAIHALTGFAPTTPLAVGIPRFARWFLDYHRVEN
jgi:UDP-glucuronate 4-epimerase